MLKATLIAISVLLSGCTFLPVEKTSTSPITIEITGGKKKFDRELVDMIIRHEGYRRHPYNDRGSLSVGYARNLTLNGISEDEALYLLGNDIKRLENELLKRYPFTSELNSTRFGVLISMGYNMGLESLSGFNKMWRAIENRDFVRAGLEIYLSDYCGQVGQRCRELAEMMEKGYPRPVM